VEADRARQAAAQSDLLRQQAEKEKQLNTVLSTRDSARGLIANMPDALFKSGSFELLTAARERLAKVSGFVLAYPSLHLALDGHTDSVGDEYNRHLRNAGPRRCAVIWSSREFLRTRSQPAASGKVSRWRLINDAPEARQQNRRLELVLSGDAIGSLTGIDSATTGLNGPAAVRRTFVVA
jgi:outer membrane protein OmpA-like peptidoglycan-associated protein